MTKSTTLILLWMLAFTMLGFIFGWLVGLLFSRTKYAEDKAEYLHNLLQQGAVPNQQRQLKQMRSVLNDAHKHILALAKYIHPD